MTATLPAAPRPRTVPVHRDTAEAGAATGPCVVTIGVFDGMHRGHRRLVGQARAVADRLGLPLVLVTFDPHPARVLGIPRDTATLSTVEHRAELAADAGADAVCVLRFTREVARRRPEEFAREVLARDLRARAVVVGANFTFGAQGGGTVDTLAELGPDLGFTAHGVPLLQTVDAPCSSTHVRACLRAGDVVAAARALGRPHRVDGRRSGRVVALEPDTALPPAGDYAGLVDGRSATVTLDTAGGLTIDDAAGPDGPVTVTFLDRRPRT